MKLKNKDILSFYAADFTGKKLPLKLSFALKLNKDVLKGPAEAYDLQRKELVEKHAEKDKNGEPVIENNNYIIKDREALTNDMNELFNIEIKANIETIDFNILEKCDLPEFDTLTVDEIEAIYFMISR